MIDNDSDLINDDAKRSISLRIHTSDHGKVRIMANRLRTRESDVFRFALKIALAALEPLYNRNCKGVDLMPLLIEHGLAIAKHFHLDSRRLELIVNAGIADDGKRVDLEDIELLAMSYVPQRHLFAKLQELTRRKIDPFEIDETLRQYLIDKYGNDQQRLADDGVASHS